MLFAIHLKHSSFCPSADVKPMLNFLVRAMPRQCMCLLSLCVYHRYRKAKIDCLSLFMCPLLAQLKIGFFSSFSAAAVYSTNETNKAGLKQSIIFRCLWRILQSLCVYYNLYVLKRSVFNFYPF
jgi:hypothetical protein